MADTAYDKAWRVKFDLGMASRGGERLQISPSVLHRLEAESGITEELSAMWDETMRRWFG